VVVEDNLPESFKRIAFHPSAFFYAWKKVTLEKLFDEFLRSNIAIKNAEAILVEEKVLRIIPLRDGQIKLFEWKNELEKGEEWYDFVERSTKEMMNVINGWDLEKNARPDLRLKVWYHFELEEG